MWYFVYMFIFFVYFTLPQLMILTHVVNMDSSDITQITVNALNQNVLKYDKVEEKLLGNLPECYDLIERDEFHKLKGLKMVCMNIQSLRKKVSKVKEKLIDKFTDVVALTETWLDSNVKDSELNIKNFNLEHVERSYATHGGICIYIRDNLNYERCIQNCLSTPDYESLIIIPQKDKLNKHVKEICILFS